MRPSRSGISHLVLTDWTTLLEATFVSFCFQVHLDIHVDPLGFTDIFGGWPRAVPTPIAS